MKEVSNLNSINIEICVNSNSNYNIARKNCIGLVQKLMQDTGINADHIIRHYDAKEKYCPRKMLDKPELWKNFKEKINKEAINMERLETQVQDLAGRVEKLENPIICNYIDNNMPDWAREPIRQLVASGVIKRCK